MLSSTQNIELPVQEHTVEEPENTLLSGDKDQSSDWSYRFALIFLGIYYIRPQDWISGMAGFNIIRLIMMGWMATFLLNGSRSPLKGWFRTPHDWAIVALYIYVAWNAPSEAGATSGVFSLVAFYFLTTQALSSWDKVLGYLKCWNILLVTLATLGVLQTVGIDITSGKALTEMFFGRLALGTWLADNPNALGHSVIAAIPLSYILIFWRGTVIARTVVFPIFVTLIVWCAWKTESKGAFTVGGVLTVLVFVVGRPKWVKVIVLAAALIAGIGALKFLPRMEQMGNLREDEGVMGRLMAWELAKLEMEQRPYGVGWKQFVAWIDWQEGDYIETLSKSTHCSYVQAGADLGRYGLFFWLLALWTAFRSVLTFKSLDENEERCRRAILLLVVAYTTSNWMINREYHTEYYLLIAVAAAFHRLRWATEIESQGAVISGDGSDENATPSLDSKDSIDDEETMPDEDADKIVRPIWKRLGLIDLAGGIAMVYAVLEIWDYILVNL